MIGEASPGARMRLRALWPILAVSLLTLLPLVVALVLYAHPQWVPEGRVHHGELILPPKPLDGPLFTTLEGAPFSMNAWRGRWTLLRVVRACGTRCRRDLDTLTRIHRLLGANQERLQDAVAVLATATAPALGRVIEAFPGTYALRIDREGRTAFDAGLYILDPDGRAILRYPPGFDPFGVLEDVKRLLKYSWVG